MQMKTLLSFLGASLMTLSFLSAEPIPNPKKNCSCQNCPCSQGKDCGCCSQEGCSNNCHCSAKKNPTQENH